MGALTPDERAEEIAVLREIAAARTTLRTPGARERIAALADKLEAEPEPQSFACAHNNSIVAEPCDRCPVRERDEARTALRGLLDAEAAAASGNLDGIDQLGAALKRAEAVLDGVERTHTLVPVALLEALIDFLESMQTRQAFSAGTLDDLAERFAAVVREWPS